ncbi:TonB-dependent receptor (plasmid) [Lichenicola cladoniae]|uniref:TonB-dependent receptor n=1 Tax=Lichenicola cladoniae TaxID=1484109 RepID=A0A6M8HXH1_9PROT|nr:TonB-dependent receptor [Lichenicola cladoniae]NPD68658.1 TonB-dependent receptor [Acetobacteraceae bacterium]QKE93040.1 TonB-dependent receptor [Lichenicola cladoniae]
MIAKPAAFLLATTCLISPSAFAQPAEDPANTSSSEQVIVTGTRDPHQTARKSLSPITVVSAKELAATGQPDLRDALTHLAPSITREVLNGGNANFLDTIALRTLSQDETLILVNGKRRHTTSVINDTGAQLGSTPVDIGMIPISAIDHIEILQDGAAAQYGSDAIAGVVNIILKTTNHGVTAQGEAGGYYKADGFTTDDAVGGGISLGNSGYLNLNAEFKHQDNTNRGGPDNRLGQPVDQFFGSPQETRETVSYNAGYDLSSNISLYSFATYGHRNGESWQYYRVPSLLPQVFPAGFDPVSAIDENDYSVTAGIKDYNLGGWTLDLSTTYGGDNTDFSLFNSVNTSLYAATGATPTRFSQMSYANTDWTTDLGLQRAFDLPLLASPLNFSIGAQYRYDTYDVRPGEPASYYGSGPQGQDGLSPISRSSSGRDVTAGYIDVSTHILPHWQIDLAGRFEHYTDAGNTETGKVSTRYDFNRFVAVRGTVSNGFRAPTLAEEHFTSLETTPTGASGILAVDSAAARSLGARALKPERSTNFSAGLVLNPIDRLQITIDGYRINIRDRITLGGVYNGQSAINALESQGIALASTVVPDSVSAQYFANAASTYTSGIDIAATYITSLGRYGRIAWDASFNANYTYVKNIAKDQNGNALLNAQDVAYLSTYFPRNKLIVGGHWTKNRWDIALHEIRYGSATSQLTYVSGANAYSNSVFDEFVDQPRFETDLSVGYQVTPHLHLTLGANNLFNAYPSRIPYNTSYLGVDRSDKGIEQIGINGGFYYLAANIAF